MTHSEVNMYRFNVSQIAVPITDTPLVSSVTSRPRAVSLQFVLSGFALLEHCLEGFRVVSDLDQGGPNSILEVRRLLLR